MGSRITDVAVSRTIILLGEKLIVRVHVGNIPDELRFTRPTIQISKQACIEASCMYMYGKQMFNYWYM